MIRRAPPNKTLEKWPHPSGPVHTLSVRTVVIGGAALLILLAWLQFILALQIASTGRQIQIANDELQKIKRDNLAIVRDIAVAESQQNMAARAAALGYTPQTPLYLPVAQTVIVSGTLAANQAGEGWAGTVKEHSPVTEFLLHISSYDPTPSGQPSSRP